MAAFQVYKLLSYVTYIVKTTDVPEKNDELRPGKLSCKESEK